MRGIKIDPTNRIITEVDVERPNKSLQSLCELIGCSIVEPVYIDKEIVLLCDENAKLKPITGAFRFYGCPDFVIAGNAVLLGYRNGRFIKLWEDIENIRKIIEWIEPE